MSFGGYPIAPGGAGTPGTDGKDAFAATYADFTWGNANEDLFFQVPAGSVDWMAPLQWISVSDGVHAGYLTVIEVGAVDPEAPEYQLVHAMDNGTAGNPTVGTVIASGAIVAVSGKPGPAGANGADGASGSSALFGSGSDGSSTASAGTTTYTVPKYFTTLTIPSGAVVVAEEIHCSVALDVQAGGALRRNGNAASGITAGAALADNVMGGGSAGGGGATGAFGSGTAGTFAADSVGGLGGAGGAGGGGGGAGGAGGGQSGPGASATGWRVPQPAGRWFAGATCHLAIGGTGGGAGGGTGTGSTGAGGGGGGFLFIAAKFLTCAGTISANGGAGAAASGGNCGGGGGGGGGVVMYVAQTATVTGTISAAGGAGGAAAGSGVAGTAGAAGVVIALVG